MNKIKQSLCAVLLLSLSISGISNAQEVRDSNSAEVLGAGSPLMECFVDTALYDEYATPICWGLETRPDRLTTNANFRIRNVPSDFTILWSDDRCSSDRNVCILRIRVYRPITLEAVVLDNSNGTFTSVSATAFYETDQ
ncbi:hypothetical protein [Microbulbifer discodermiae]|uniref:hypothetical protein n=1 Tax=Microbulbifer sp. 2201CG32-9 TaxID=3232309 RepID=UPI00345C2B0B